MWRAGPLRGCDAVLRPRGRAARGPREAKEAHKAQTRGRRPRVSTRPRGRPCGRHLGEGAWRGDSTPQSDERNQACDQTSD